MTRSIFSEKYERFMAMLKEARAKKRMTQVDLSLKLGRKQSYVSKFERGERRLDIIEFLEIAEVLDINVLEFVERLL